MFTRVFRWTLSTFYRVTLKYLYYSCHYCILCEPFDSRLGTELLARCVCDCIVPFNILNLTSGPSANMSPKYDQNRLSCGLTDIGICLPTVTGYVALMLRTEVWNGQFVLIYWRKFCLGYHSVATRFPFISGVLGRHDLTMSDSQDALGIVRLLWYLETILLLLLLRRDCGLLLSSM